MKKFIPIVLKIIVCLNLFELVLISRPTSAFLPTINEPNLKELQETSIKIGKTAIQLISLGQAKEAIKLFELAIKLNPNESSLWIGLAEAQIRSERKNQALFSLNKAII